MWTTLEEPAEGWEKLSVLGTCNRIGEYNEYGSQSTKTSVVIGSSSAQDESVGLTLRLSLSVRYVVKRWEQMDIQNKNIYATVC